MKPQTKEKLNARKRYWGLVVATQDQFSKSVIYQKLRTKDIIEETKPKPYSWMHGPYATTLFAISDALGYKFKAVRK